MGDLSLLSSYLSRGSIPKLAPALAERRCITSDVEGFFFTNPSITATDGTIVVSVRALNNPVQLSSYRGALSYGGDPRTGIELFRLGPELTEMSRMTLVDARNAHGFFGDARIFFRDAACYHVGTYWAPDGAVRPAILTPSGDIVPLALPFQPTTKEKNWTPIANGGDALFLCQPLPPVVCEYSLTSGELVREVRGPHRPNNGKLLAHGGTGPVSVGESWLCICRQRFEVPRAGLAYVQRAVFLDREFDVEWISGPWVVDSLGIEVVNGAAIHEDRLYLSWGRDDREAHVAYLPLSQAFAWFKQLPRYAVEDARRATISQTIRLLAELDRARRSFDRRSD